VIKVYEDSSMRK